MSGDGPLCDQEVTKATSKLQKELTEQAKPHFSIKPQETTGDKHWALLKFSNATE